MDCLTLDYFFFMIVFSYNYTLTFLKTFFQETGIPDFYDPNF